LRPELKAYFINAGRFYRRFVTVLTLQNRQNISDSLKFVTYLEWRGKNSTALKATVLVGRESKSSTPSLTSLHCKIKTFFERCCIVENQAVDAMLAVDHPVCNLLLKGKVSPFSIRCLYWSSDSREDELSWAG